MNEFDEAIKKIKSTLKNMITSDTPQEQIQTLAELDKNVDIIIDTNKEQKDRYEKLKDDFIDALKRTGFKEEKETRNDITGDKKEKSFDDFLNEQIEKGKEKGD